MPPYDEEEQKNQSPIIERLTKLETMFNERWLAHDQFAIDRQSATCKKLDELKFNVQEIKTQINCLPCDINIEKISGLDKLGDRAGRIVFWGVTAVISFSVLWGSLLMRVQVNTIDIASHEISIDKLEKVSYGYQDYINGKHTVPQLQKL